MTAMGDDLREFEELEESVGPFPAEPPAGSPEDLAAEVERLRRTRDEHEAALREALKLEDLDWGLPALVGKVEEVVEALEREKDVNTESSDELHELRARAEYAEEHRERDSAEDEAEQEQLRAQLREAERQRDATLDALEMTVRQFGLHFIQTPVRKVLRDAGRLP